MKKFLKGVVLFFSVLLTLPLLLTVAANVASFAFFYSRLSHRDTSTCTQYYTGVDKGTIWEGGEWHHYVDFKVEDTTSARRWRVTDAPLPASIWREYSTSTIKRVAYRWPSNWWDPFPASDWKICVASS